MTVVSGETKKSAQPGRCPEPPLIILEQIMYHVVRQAVMFGVVLKAAIRPVSKESVGGCDPQRTAAIFQQVVYVNLCLMSAGRAHVHGQELETIVVPVQPVEVFHSSAPDRSGAVLVEHVDGAGLTIIVFGNNDGEHWSGVRFVIR